MKQATFIEGVNFKGRSFRQELAPVSLFCGNNFTGKTARIQALILAYTGYVPGVSSRPEEIFARLSSGNPMSVRVGNDACNILRKFEEKNGKVKASHTSEGLPDDFAIPDMLLDSGAFFSISGPERTKMMFSRCKADITIEGIRSSVLTNVKNIKLDPHEEPAEKSIALAVKELNDAFDLCLSAKLDVQTTVEQIVHSFGEAKKLADQNAKRLAATVQGLTQVASTDPAAPADVEQQLAQARQALEKANTEVGRLKGVGESLAKELETVRKQAVTADQNELLKEIEQLSQSLAGAQSVPQPEPFDVSKYPIGEDHAENLAELATKKAVVFTLSTEDLADESQVKLAASVAQDRLSDAERNAAPASAEWQRLTKELAATESETTCSKCGQSLVALKAQVIALLNERIFAAHTEMTRHLHIVNHCKQLYSEAFAAHNEVVVANQKIRDARAGYHVLEQQTLAIRSKIEQEAQAAWNLANSRYVTAQSEITRLNSQISALRAKMEDKSAADAAAKLPELEMNLENARVLYRAAAEVQMKSKSDVMALEEKGRQLQRQRADIASRQRTVDEADRSKTEAQVMKLVCEFLAEMQGEIIKRAVGPLLDRVNMICEPLLERPLVYQDGEIGLLTENGKLVSKTLSGSELALMHASVSIALAVESPIKLLILDELSRLDKNRKLKLIRHLCVLVHNGVIDQAILIDPNPEPFTEAQDATLIGFEAFNL